MKREKDQDNNNNNNNPKGDILKEMLDLDQNFIAIKKIPNHLYCYKEMDISYKQDT